MRDAGVHKNRVFVRSDVACLHAPSLVDAYIHNHSALFHRFYHRRRYYDGGATRFGIDGTNKHISGFECAKQFGFLKCGGENILMQIGFQPLQLVDRVIENLHQGAHAKRRPAGVFTHGTGANYHHLRRCDARKPAQHPTGAIFFVAQVFGGDMYGGRAGNLADGFYHR